MDTTTTTRPTLCWPCADQRATTDHDLPFALSHGDVTLCDGCVASTADGSDGARDTWPVILALVAIRNTGLTSDGRTPFDRLCDGSTVDGWTVLDADGAPTPHGLWCRHNDGTLANAYAHA